MGQIRAAAPALRCGKYKGVSPADLSADELRELRRWPLDPDDRRAVYDIIRERRDAKVTKLINKKGARNVWHERP